MFYKPNRESGGITVVIIESVNCFESGTLRVSYQQPFVAIWLKIMNLKPHECQCRTVVCERVSKNCCSTFFLELAISIE